MKKTYFGKVNENKSAYLYTLSNRNGIEMTVSDFGAVLTRLLVPDIQGRKRDIVLGYESLAGYQKNTDTYFGSTVGRNANRIAGARFELDGRMYRMPANEGENNLHSGPSGYQLRLWEAEKTEEEKNTITFLLHSPDGDQGFPGKLDLRVAYTLTEENEIRITYEGCSDADTVFNPTNHSYFNLGGHDFGSILSHELTLFADRYTPVTDSASIPTGELAQVAGTPMDFRKGKPIGQEIDSDFEQLRFTGGYDHNFVLCGETGKMKKAARVSCKESGITLEVETDLPGIQFYAGNFLKDETGKCGVVYRKRNGFCLETQYFPNAINEPAFASPVIKAGEKRETQTIYRIYRKE